MRHEMKAIPLLALLLVSCALQRPDPDMAAGCEQIIAFSHAGDHQAASLAAASLGERTAACPMEVQDSLRVSRLALTMADSLVHRALVRRRKGDLVGARECLLRALEIYPRYWWVKKLLGDLERNIKAQVESLSSEASYLEAQGDVDSALERISQALTLCPEDSAFLRLRDELAERRMEKKESLAGARIQRAKELAAAGRLVEAEACLAPGPDWEGKEGERTALHAEIQARREEGAGRVLAESARRQEEGDLDNAWDLLAPLLTESPCLEKTRGGLIEAGRSLGTRFFGRGELSRAREVWLLTLDLDQGNEKLLRYLEEVRERLEFVRRIREGPGPAEGKQ